ncbi:MAG: peptidylprolyl isomerase [Bacteroidia bacterium]|nr:peptidylprolyl isomerase [Bacteroidia bacterium]
MKRCLLAFVLLLSAFISQTQAQVIDRVIGVVGEDVILKSDIENRYAYYMANGQEDDGTLRCSILENLIVEKLLSNKARQDSLPVSEEQVANEAKKRIAQFLQQMPKEELEKIYGKPISQIEDDLKPDIENQLLMEAMRNKVLENVSVTPREVKEFFKSIPEDSIPYLPAEVELYHIVITPPWSEESKTRAKQELEEIRAMILKGDISFADAAKKYSQGPSAPNGGSLGEFGRTTMVAEFNDVIFNMKEGEVSEVFESPFGMHIAKLHKRLGERVRASHILRIPQRTLNEDELAKAQLARIRAKILADSISFQKAAIKYSMDQATKDCGGCIKNPNSGELFIPLDMLDADLFFKVDNMKVGEITEPEQLFQPGSTEKLFHILYLKSKIPPHKANLKDDYQKLSAAALQSKQAEKLEEWFKSARKNIYLEILDENCQEALKKFSSNGKQQ